MLGMYECGMCRMFQRNYYSWWEGMTLMYGSYIIDSFFPAYVVIV